MTVTVLYCLVTTILQLVVVKEAKKDHDLEHIPSSRQYRTRPERRIQRKGLYKDVEYDWKLDTGEYAQRIWHCWKPKKTCTISMVWQSV